MPLSLSASRPLFWPRVLALAVSALLMALPLQAQTAYPATLAGHVVMPANSFIAAPKDAPEGQKRTDCFHDIASFKRVYKVELSDANVGGAVRKIGYIDLMAIADPARLARKPLNNGVLTFPFFAKLFHYKNNSCLCPC